jgi:hypothetical protein
MSEPLFMYMLLTRGDYPSGPSDWTAVKVEQVGRTFTRAQAEHVAHQVHHHPARFLFPYTDQTAQFADGDAPPTLAMMPGETIWHYGEPFRVDLVAILRKVAGDPLPGGAVEAPDRDKFPLSVDAVVVEAVRRFGPCDSHDVQARFDQLVSDLGGFRHGAPAFYHVPFEIIGGIRIEPEP